MKKGMTLLLSALFVVSAVVVVACGDDDDSAGDKCEQAGQAMLDAMDEACSGKDDECCYCQCYNSDQTYDAMAYATDGTCTCEDYATTDADADGDVDTTCEGETLEAAEECLADVDACTQPMVDGQNAACDATPL